jgi:hypothetical protein
MKKNKYLIIAIIFWILFIWLSVSGCYVTKARTEIVEWKVLKTEPGRFYAKYDIFKSWFPTTDTTIKPGQLVKISTVIKY